MAHKLGAGLEETISVIERWGTPSLIAVDVRPAPSFAARLASSFNATLFVPEHPWREEQKKELMKKLGVSPENAHERDALSAAVVAYRAHQNLLGPANSEKELSPEERDLLKHLLLSGMRRASAIEIVKNQKQGEKTSPQTDSSKTKNAAQLPSSRPQPALAHQLLSLERINSELRKRIAFLENENSALAQKLKRAESSFRGEVMRDRAIMQLRYDVARLKSEIERMRKKPKKSKSVNPPEPANLKALDGKMVDLERMIQDYRKGSAGR